MVRETKPPNPRNGKGDAERPEKPIFPPETGYGQQQK
jgi:hypothetical protein